MPAMQAVVRTPLRLASAALIVLSAGQAAICQTDRNPPPPQSDSPQVLAVVVGIAKYPRLPGGQQLQFADRDAAAFASSLQTAGVSPKNIHLLTGADATTARIKSEIGGWLARSARAEDTVYIFFSGHAFVERDFGESYLLTYDSDPQNAYGSALSIGELEHAFVRRIKAGHVVVIGDAVRRDLFDPDAGGGSASEAFVKSFTSLAGSRKGLTALLASSPGEFSREGQRWGGLGVFTKLLTEGLAGGADRNHDGQVTDEELFDYLATRVSQETSNKQHPWRTEPSGAPLIIAGARNTSIRPAPASSPGNVVSGGQQTAQAQQAPAQPQPQPKQTSGPGAIAKAEPPSSVARPAAAPANNASGTAAATPPSTNAPQPPTNKQTARPSAASESQPATLSGQPARPALTSASQPAPLSGQPARPSTNESSKPPPKQPARPPAASGGIAASTPPASNMPAPPGGEIAVASSTPPRPLIMPPKPAVPASVAVENRVEGTAASVAVPEATGVPSPLILQLQAAIASGNLIEPKSASAWDLYQRLSQDQSSAPDLPRLRIILADAFLAGGKQIVSGDVRSDNITARLEDFRRAGQMFSRARSLRSNDPGIATLEKLSAAEALIALQFYDEAERTLSALQDAKLAAAQNAMGLVYLGSLSDWQAERSFKRAIEMDPKWAAPHYNLGLLYRSQQKDESLAELEGAATIEPANPAMLVALGDEYFARKQWERAATAYRAAIKVDPKNDSFHTKLGHALYSLGRHEEANLEYQRAREIAGKSQ
jgi:tetratricopeptide (TPR) repeat protein